MNLSLKLKSTSAIFVRTKAASYKAQIRQDYYNAIEGKKDSILQSVFRKIQKRFQNMLTIKDEAVDAFEYLSRIEGIIPAIESAHAVAYAKKIVPQMDKAEIVVITLSGRGDKDCAAIARYRGENIHE